MKKEYIAPQMEKVVFDTEDIILTSNANVKPLEFVGGQHANELGSIEMYFLQ